MCLCAWLTSDLDVCVWSDSEPEIHIILANGLRFPLIGVWLVRRAGLHVVL
jgi:hypothetical protein